MPRKYTRVFDVNDVIIYLDRGGPKMHNINELIGIIKGINFDGIINEKEVLDLRQWVEKNRNLAYEPTQVELIKLVSDVVEDLIIDDKEREILLEYAYRYEHDQNENDKKIYELNGIIEGIICDGEVNEAEIYRLNEWMRENREKIINHKPSQRLCRAIDEVLEDGIVTEEEQQKMLQMLSSRINNTQFETKLNYLCKQVKAKQNIGLDLIDLLYNQEAIEEIHDRAMWQLQAALNSYTGSYTSNGEIVFISLCLIGMLEYDGAFYDSVRVTYKDLYKKYNQQKIETLIRTILDRYRSEEQRNNRRGAKNAIINVVLANSIVPSYYLEGFFEFIYDIYKMNFDYSIPKDLYGEFKFVYDGLRCNMLSEGDSIQDNVTKKTYKLISTTKHLIADNNSIDSIIKLSIIVVNLIDKRIWNKPINVVNPYLKCGYEKWESTIKKDLIDVNSDKGKSRDRWKPDYVLIGNDIYLIPPVHKIKAQYKSWEVCVQVLSGEKVIYEDNNPDIREIIAGYKIIPQRIKIEEPCNEISYRLLAGAKEIYNSRKSLYRRYLVFNSEGEELKNNTDYEGTVIICYKDINDNLQAYFKTDNYLLASKNVRLGDFCYICGEIFNFTSLIKPGIFGNEYEKVHLVKEGQTSKIQLYKEVKNIVFECEASPNNVEVKINERLYDLNALAYISTTRGGINKYIVSIPQLKDGIYDIYTDQYTDGHKNRICNFCFALDSHYQAVCEKLSDDIFLYKISNGLIGNSITGQISLSDFNEMSVKFQYKGITYAYELPFNLEAYRISGSKWKSMNNDMWIGDINNDTVIDVYDSEIDSIDVYSMMGRKLDSLNIKDMNVYKSVSIGSLVNYKNEFDFVYIALMHNGRIKRPIFCNNKCQIRPETEVIINTVTGVLSINPWFYGKGNLCCEVLNEKEECVYKQENLINNTNIEVNDLVSGERYQIVFSEKAKGLSLSQKKYSELKRYERVFYSRKDYVGKEFKILDACYMENDSVKKCELSKSYLKITEQKSQDVFTGELYMRESNSMLRSNLVKPVKAEIYGDVINGCIDAIITYKDEYLTYDSQRKHVTNSTMNHGEKITSYIISIM